MDIVNVQTEISNRIARLDKGMKKIEETGHDLALADAEYERDLAITMLKIEHGTILEIDGVPIGKITASTLKDKAKAACYEQKLRLGMAQSAHKAAMEKMNTIRAQLNGYQSIFRHLDQA